MRYFMPFSYTGIRQGFKFSCFLYKNFTYKILKVFLSKKNHIFQPGFLI